MSFFTNKMDWMSRRGKIVIVLISSSVLLPLIGDYLSNRKYPSLAQAENACNAWEGKGIEHEYQVELSDREKVNEFLKLNPDGLRLAYKRNSYEEYVSRKERYVNVTRYKILSIFSRYCEEETDTNQYLGYINQVVERKKYDGLNNKGEYEIVKHFRY